MIPLNQGYLDGLCGVYSIVNSNILVNNASIQDSQQIFNELIDYLYRKRLLKPVLLEGLNIPIMRQLMHLTESRFGVIIGNRKSVKSLKQWWDYSKSFLEEKPNRAIILSVGGRADHFTVIERMTQRTIYFKDSSEWKKLNRAMCRLPDYNSDDKYIIYPSQCWYLGRE